VKAARFTVSGYGFVAVGLQCVGICFCSMFTVHEDIIIAGGSYCVGIWLLQQVYSV
jgi:hypothetical protein